MNSRLYSIFSVLRIAVLLAFASNALAADKTIAIIATDDNHANKEYVQKIIDNTNKLLEGQFTLTFKTFDGDNDSRKIRAFLQQQYQDSQTDLIITTGILASQELLGLKHRKPSIAGLVIDEQLQGLKPTKQNSSGIDNLAYIRSPFAIESDIKLFKRLTPIKNLGILLDKSIEGQAPLIKKYFDNILPEANFSMISIDKALPDNALQSENGPIDAVYVLPLITYNRDEITSVMQQLEAKKIPSFAMVGREYVELGAMAGQSSSEYAESYSRRIALDVMKIFNGQKPSQLSVSIAKLPIDFVINLQVANAVEVYPSFNVLNEADIINQVVENGTKLSLRTAVQETIENNLSIRQARIQLKQSKNQVSSAKRAFLPSLDVSAKLEYVDDYTASNTGSELVSSVGANFQQILFSERALGEYKARKISYSAQLEALRVQELNAIDQILTAYVQYLSAKRQLNVQKENVTLTQKNLDIAKRKEKTGYSGVTDVYRLESQVAQNQASLNTALANVNIAKLRIKNILNRSASEPIGITDIASPISLTMLADGAFFKSVNNEADGEKLIQFLINEAMVQQPSLLQLDFSIASQQRSLRSEKRRRYVPEVYLGAGANDILKQHKEVRKLPDEALDPTWSVSLNVTLPLFDSQRSPNIKNQYLVLDDLATQRASIINQINFDIRSSMETAVAAYQENELFQVASKSADKNYEVMSKYYQQGKISISDLIDAQNNALTSKLNALNSSEDFLIKFLTLEKNIGFYYFLLSAEKQKQFVQRFVEHMNQ